VRHVRVAGHVRRWRYARRVREHRDAVVGGERGSRLEDGGFRSDRFLATPRGPGN
jgi:hypothetical protein